MSSMATATARFNQNSLLVSLLSHQHCNIAIAIINRMERILSRLSLTFINQSSFDLRILYLNVSSSPDLSRNKLVEVPNECTNYYSLERLLLYHNIIKSIPDNISALQSLVYLDISRNQLSYLPSSVCLLQHLQCLVAHNNRLVSLPEEIGEMNKLMELDVSCNEIAHLPVQIGDLANLRSLHLRRNHLQEVRSIRQNMTFECSSVTLSPNPDPCGADISSIDVP